MVSIVPFGETIRIQYELRLPLQELLPSFTFTCFNTVPFEANKLGKPDTVTDFVRAVAQLLFEFQASQPEIV